MRISVRVDNSIPSSPSKIELLFLKRVQLLGEEKHFVNRIRKSFLSLPHNSKVLFSSAAVFLYCVFQVVARSIVKALQIMKKSSLVVARSIEKSLQIMKKSSFVKFLFYSLMLIASIIYVLISMNGPSNSVDDFALKSFDHDMFMNQLSVSMPLIMYENDAWGNT